ncbi:MULTISPECIES: DUF3429 domain-containing protein [Pseudoalteromonas]|uniref:DUF3429 domain-containing protein n=1 Tax=Pseudoalteromonas peptidolytica F12-50-A1 TaxID=1315280 RepID=A0A8I0T7L7_9GAMM|nr:MULTISPECIES: DUF3429 domain-containing protein [Pseudoalteromonas]MBE0348334.1 hypothetical protein [Pseudoalteromonas peptidolytica F12-50-A1]MDW7549091.1 DUF3429 domain-containing protein [Pseudoalteromonas peptidolytica]NLR16965.1 DUF3429 domain-containing protein [Pseudoalteromonas peptidolytica]RRS09256.1 DUF3429 family protein [Pseudoalteromonas sp. J010]RXF01561.1 DUF3429 family protein [Pseudoalteromonas sp. PS5]
MHPYFNHIQLGYLGFVPFLACIAWTLMTGASANTVQAFQFYSFGILAFMAGSLWRAGQQTQSQAILAVVVVIPYPLLSFLTLEWSLVYLSVAYWLVYLIERLSPMWKEYHKDYQKMRTVLSAMVFVGHLFMISQALELSA